MKQRKPIQRKTPLKRTSILKRKRSAVPLDVRNEVFLRDQDCRARRLVPELRCWGRLDPHHTLRKSQGGEDTVDNLITLCRAHHDWVHGNPTTSLELGLLRTKHYDKGEGNDTNTAQPIR
jgi:hypothetical protein